MDIAATVNPATVHFRSLSEPSRLGVLEQNYEYDLLEPDKLLRKYVGRDVTLVRMRAAGRDDRDRRSDRAASELQQCARLANRQRDCHRHARRPHPLSRTARESLRAADAHLDARERRRHQPPGRSRVSGRQALLGRRLRPQRRARRQGGGPRWLGDADQRQRDGVPQRAGSSSSRAISTASARRSGG